jgi:hypothetical protein
VDISLGSGDSNSVISVGAVEMGMKVAEFASPRVSPERLAEIAAWMASGSAGNGGARSSTGRATAPAASSAASWSRSWAGRSTTRSASRGRRRSKKTEQFGWHNNKQRKLVAAARYRTALEKDRLINPNNESLDETLEYVIDETGALIPGGHKDLTTGARETHGDRVIADMVLWLAMQEAPKRGERRGRPPDNSPMGGASGACGRNGGRTNGPRDERSGERGLSGGLPIPGLDHPHPASSGHRVGIPDLGKPVGSVGVARRVREE